MLWKPQYYVTVLYHRETELGPSLRSFAIKSELNDDTLLLTYKYFMTTKNLVE